MDYHWDSSSWHSTSEWFVWLGSFGKVVKLSVRIAGCLAPCIIIGYKLREIHHDIFKKFQAPYEFLPISFSATAWHVPGSGRIWQKPCQLPTTLVAKEKVHCHCCAVGFSDDSFMYELMTQAFVMAFVHVAHVSLVLPDLPHASFSLSLGSACFSCIPYPQYSISCTPRVPTQCAPVPVPPWFPFRCTFNPSVHIQPYDDIRQTLYETDQHLLHIKPYLL